MIKTLPVVRNCKLLLQFLNTVGMSRERVHPGVKEHNNFSPRSSMPWPLVKSEQVSTHFARSYACSLD